MFLLFPILGKKLKQRAASRISGTLRVYWRGVFMWLATTNVPYGAQPVMTDQQCQWWKARKGREKLVDSHVRKIKKIEVGEAILGMLVRCLSKLSKWRTLGFQVNTSSESVKVWSKKQRCHESASLRSEIHALRPGARPTSATTSPQGDPPSWTSRDFCVEFFCHSKSLNTPKVASHPRFLKFAFIQNGKPPRMPGGKAVPERSDKATEGPVAVACWQSGWKRYLKWNLRDCQKK